MRARRVFKEIPNLEAWPQRQSSAMEILEAVRQANCEVLDDLIVQLREHKRLDLLNARDENQWTPLHTAAAKGFTHIIESLLRAGVDVHLVNSHGYTALHLAAYYGFIQAVQLLVYAGADVNTPCNDGSAPLHSACHHGHLAIANLLLRNGADANVRNISKDKSTPLHHAANYGHHELVQLLLNAGADPCVETVAGHTPLSYARHQGFDKVITALVAAGASSNSPTTSARNSPSAETHTVHQKRTSPLGDRYVIQIESLKRELDLAKETISDLQAQNEVQSDAQNDAVQQENRMLRRKVDDLQQLAVQAAEADQLHDQVDELRVSLQEEETRRKQAEDALHFRQNDIDDLTRQLTLLTERYRSAESIRRKLHAQVQELRGTIRVYCRVRPFVPSIDRVAHNDDALRRFWHFPDNDVEQRSITMRTTKASAVSGDREVAHSFEFDRVFDPAAAQSDVYEDLRELIQSAIDGYKVCIFAYGQTGSGKTHTMQGELHDEKKMGVLPRSIRHMFDWMNSLKDRGWTYEVSAVFMEVYNEQVRDLLNPSQKRSKVRINHQQLADNGETITEVSGVPLHPVRDADELRHYIDLASNARTSAATNMNDVSSRSHAIFQLHIKGTNTYFNKKTYGVLNLIDLAGSERLSRSDTGDANRRQETTFINKSLTALGDVIHALKKKQDHIPYRRSELTYLLQNYLGAGTGSRTLMLVTVSPTEASLGESLCTLRFAEKVNACHVGQSVQNVATAKQRSNSRQRTAPLQERTNLY